MATPKNASKSTSTTAPKTAKKTVKGIKVNFFTLGSDAKEIGIKAGMTLADFRKERGLESVNVSLNDTKNPSGTTELQQGDRIVVVPQAKGGLN